LPYTSLDPDKILATTETLARRISERFPGTGLEKVGAELIELARHTDREARALDKPIW
jgi:hypothetical protein